MATHLRALMVDDSEEDTELLLLHLKRHGYGVEWQRVDTAEGLRAALAGGTWDIALCDYVMPRLSGPDALAILRAVAPEVPAIVVSGQIGEEYPVDVMRAGARDYVNKNNLSRLVPAVERELAEADERNRRRQSEEELATARALLEQMVAASVDVIFVKDQHGRYLIFNPAAERTTGKRAAEVCGRDDTVLFPPDEARAIIADDRRIMATRSPRIHEETLSGPGGPRVFLSTKGPLTDARGNVIGLFGIARDITERKATEAKVREREEQYSSLLRSTTDGVWVVDRDGRLLDVNAAACEMTGYGRDELLGRSVPDIEAEQDAAEVARRIAQISREGSARFTSRHRCKDGRVIDVDVSTTFVPHLGGRLYSFIRDITVRKRADAALQQAERQYGQLVDTLQEGVWAIDQNASTVFVNPVMAEMLGYTRAEMLGRSLFDFMTADAAAAAGRLWQRRLVGVRERHDFEFRHKDGSPVYATLEARPITDAEGAVVGGIAGVVDITTRKRAENELRRTRDQLQALLDALPDLMFVVDGEGRIQEWHSSQPDALFLPPAACLGRAFAEVIPGEAAAVIADAIAEAARDGRHRGGLYALELPTGRAWFELSIALLGQPQAPDVRFVVLARDVTEHRRLEQEIRGLNADLQVRVEERTQALAAANADLEAFNDSVSHDLRAPLRQMQGFLDALREDYGGTAPAEAQRYLAQASACSQRMDRMIQALLRLSRVGRTTMEQRRVNLGALARAAFADLREAGEARAVEFVVGELPEVIGDPVLLRQVLGNLLDNAMKFTRRAASPRIEVGVERRAGEATFYVRDNGVGFDPQRAEKLFGLYQRLHRAEEFEGLGVGLSIVKRAVARHGGRVWAESTPGQGATFFFTLPAPPEGQPGCDPSEAARRAHP